MKKLSVLLLVVIAITIYSCASTMTITNDSGKVKGIPFYTQKAVVKQETKYLYSWLVVSLIKEKNKDKVTSIPVLTKRILKGQDLSELEKSLDSLNNSSDVKNDLGKVIKIISEQKVASLQSNDIGTNNIIDNRWTIQTTVDYSTKYYLNSKLPWFGSATLSQKLATNGTLAEATGSSDNQIDELITSIVGLATPISSVKVAQIENKDTPQISDNMAFLNSLSEANLKCLDKIALPRMISALSKEFITYKLKIEEEGYIYTFTKNYELNESSNAYKPIPFNLNNGNYTRSNWTKDKKETKEKQDKKPTINISGSIQLPTEKIKSTVK